MAILNLGISIRSAPIELLERLAFTDEDITRVYQHARDVEVVDETVILSTCNRVELYANVRDNDAGLLATKQLLAEARGVAPDDLIGPLYSHWAQDAADHLFAAASGLDSMVIGETQIHAQVREALRRSETEGAAGPALKALFQAATRAGRRVRQETSLGAGPDAFVAKGAELAGEVLGGLAGRDVVVLGTGEMAALAVKHLRRREVSRLTVLNRSLERAQTLAQRANAAYGDFDMLPEALRHADLVVSATGSTGPVVHGVAVRDASDGRGDRALVLLDLAMPRDVDPTAAAVDGVTVIDIVTLRERLSAHDEHTAADIARAREIVSEEVHRYVRRRRADRFAPLIRAVRRRGEEVMQAELLRHASRLGDLTPNERAAVEALAHGIVAKLLHDPIVTLKNRSAAGSDDTYAGVLAELLGIAPDVG